MKNILGLVIAGVIVVGGSIVGCTSCSLVESSNVGILVNLAGKDRGVQSMEIKSGYFLFNPINSKVVELPISVQNVIWTSVAHENNKNVDESLYFSSKEGVSINADISVSFRIDPNKAAEFYNKYHQEDLSVFSDTFLRNIVRESFNSIASQMSVEDIYGVGKNEMLTKITQDCKDKLSKDGVIIEQIAINSVMKLPDNIVAAINNSIAATQQSLAAKNKIEQIVAESKQAVAKAEGEANSAKAAAQGKADSMIIEANGKAASWAIESKAQAEYNRTVGASISPLYIQYDLAQKWNGALPTVSGVSGVITNLPK